MAQELVVPSLGESVSEAFIGKWLKPDGAPIQANEPLVELETDKANVEIRSERAGTLRIVRRDGSVRVGELIARVEDGARAETAPAPATPPQAPKAPAAPVAAPSSTPDNGSGVPSAPRRAEPTLTPAMRRRIREGSADPAEGSDNVPRGTLATGSENVPRGTLGSSNLDRTSSPLPLQAGERRAPMTRLRKRIAERLLEAQRSAAILSTFNEVDMGAVMEVRSRLKTAFQEVHGVGLGFMSFFARAVVLALRDVPVVNSEIRGEEIVSRDFVHLGVAVSTERGLVVPILRNAERRSFADLEREIARLAGLARDNKLSPDDLAGGTFTISNGGVFGSLLSTPILNPPQSGILGMHKIEDRPIAREKQVIIRPMMYVALSYDHRLIDGRDSVTFLVKVKERIEDPARLMLEI